jgi:membrane-bound transcription factor site-1 protease
MGHDGIFETEIRSSTVVVPIIVKIIPTPAREKRILWDQFHNVRYPPGYVPRDNLDVKSDVLDWHGDHPHTNYHAMYDSLLDNGYFLEVLTGPFTCFDATLYASILIVDAEEEYSKEERKKLSNDVRTLGLGLIVFGEWYNVKTMHTMRFFDDNTHEWWTPVTGGANVPALNDLLGDFGFSFGDRIIEGIARIGRDNVRISSGANVMSAPKGAFVHSASMVDKAVDAAAEQKTTHTQRTPPRRGVAVDYAVCALSDVGSGRVFVFGDSNCLDSSHMVANCFNFLLSAVKYVSDTEKQKDSCPEPLCPTGAELHTAMTGIGHAPERRTDVAFKEFSATLGGKPGNIGTTKCSPSSPLNFHDAKSSYTTPSWMPTYKKSSLSSWSSLLSSKISDKIDSMSVSSNDGSTSGSIISSNSNRFARLNLQNNQNDEEKIRGLSVDQPAVVSSSSSSSSLRRSEQHHMRDETWVMGGIGALLGVFCIRIFRVRKRRRRLRGK